MTKIGHLLCYLQKSGQSGYLRCLTLMKNYCRVTLFFLIGRASFTFLVDSDDQGCDRHAVAPPAFMPCFLLIPIQTWVLLCPITRHGPGHPFFMIKIR